jgi:uncharacterized protein YjdB
MKNLKTGGKVMRQHNSFAITKLKAIIALAIIAIIGLSFSSCGDAIDAGGTVTNEKAVYTSVDAEGNVYELTITPKSNKAAYEPKAGDTYTLKISFVDGTTKTSVGTVTHEVKSGSTVTATLSVSDASFTVTLSTVTDGLSVVTEIKGTIPITDDDNKPTIEIELTLTPQVEKESDVVIGVILNKTALELDVGGSETLVATVLPTNAKNKNVTWSSSDDAVVQVSQSGLVTAVAVGSATITVTTEDGDKEAICNVTVNEVVIIDIAVTGVSLNKDTLSLVVGTSETLVATVAPDNATNQNVTWSSSNPSIATVTNGAVTAASAGDATITVTTDDGGFTESCVVTVTATYIPVTGVTLNKETTSFLTGGLETLFATVLPSNATNKAVSWDSSAPSVATVTNGLVTAVSVGSATITVTTEDGSKTATCAVTVTTSSVAVTGVTLNKTSASIIVGGSETLTATVLPSNATNQNVSWSSSDPSIATVSNGAVTAVSAGDATITVTTEDGGFTTDCIVTVLPLSPTGVSLNKTTLEIGIDETEYLIPIFIPTNATNKNVTWSNNDPTIASVSASGLVTGIAIGSAIITVTTEDGGFTAACTVNVYLTPAHLAAYLATLPENSTSSPHLIKLRVRSIEEFETIHNALEGAPNKYVNLYLSSSTITSITDFAFYNLKSLASLTIPNSVTSIGDWAFASCDCLTSITFEEPSIVTSIGVNTFVFCEYLASVTIPNSVTSIGKDAFYACHNLANVTFDEPSKVTSIGNEAFGACFSLTSITIPNSVTSIGDKAFESCDLTSITIPNSVTSMGKKVFESCVNLISISVGPGNNFFSSENGILYNKSKSTLILCPEGKTGEVNILASVTSIGDNAFEMCNKITIVTIPYGVTSIGNSAFYSCSFANETIPNSVTSIGDHAFLGCGFANVIIPYSVISIGINAFDNGSLISVDSGNNFYSSENGILYNKNKTTIIHCPDQMANTSLKNSVTSIGDYAFSGCYNLYNVIIPNSVTSIGDHAFNGCFMLRSVTFQGNIPSSGFSTNSSFLGDLRAKFYATDPTFGTPGTYTRDSYSSVWTKQ